MLIGLSEVKVHYIVKVLGNNVFIPTNNKITYIDVWKPFHWDLPQCRCEDMEININMIDLHVIICNVCLCLCILIDTELKEGKCRHQQPRKYYR